MSLVESYFTITKEYSDKYGDNTILLMQVGAFFECYSKIDAVNNHTGSRLLEFCAICDLNHDKGNRTHGYAMAGFRDYGLERYVKKLQDANFTVVVFVQDQNCSNTTRSLKCIYSPGTSFYNNTFSNNTACIWIERTHGNKYIFGLSTSDIYTGQTVCFEHETEINAPHNPTTYDEIERFISTHSPSEVIIISNTSEKEMRDVIQYTNITTAAIHIVMLLTPQPQQTYMQTCALKCQKQTYRTEVINRIFSFKISSSIEYLLSQYEYATQSLVFLLNFIIDHNPNIVSKIAEPKFENNSDRIILANHTLKQLNIIEADQDHSASAGNLSSVLRFLNRCKTPMGSRKFKYKLLHPSYNIESLQKEYDMTEHMLAQGRQYDELRKRLGDICDIEKFNRQIHMGKVYPKTIYAFYKTLEQVEAIYGLVCNDERIMKYAYDAQPKPIPTIIQEYKKYMDANLYVDMCADIDNMMFETHIIKKGISDSLDMAITNYNEGTAMLERIRFYINKLISDGEKTDKAHEYVKLHETEKQGYSLQTTERRSKILLDQIKKTTTTCFFDITKIRIQKPSSGSTITLRHDAFDEICASINACKARIHEEVGACFTKFISSLREYDEDNRCITHFVTALDIIQNNATIASTYKYCKPTIAAVAETHSYIKVRDMRHCLIEHINQNEIYVANDVNLYHEQRGILLYGTNAVGKTSLIRALGICAIMAQAGLYVPCSSMVFYPFKNIMTRILGNDNLFRGLSSFASEMSELRVILNKINKNSLILGDEMCSSTELDSAISIFVAGLQKMYKSDGCFIFATHMHEIVDYEEITSMHHLAKKHMAVIYNHELEELVYDRKLRDGHGPSMYGLEVCKSLHLPLDFLENANNIRLKYRNKNQIGSLKFEASRYNSKKIVGLCEMCNERIGTETHHLQHQRRADDEKYIGNFHKDHAANLLSICESCHQNMHHSNAEHVRKLTTNGYILVTE
jgi:DNA mismatch repair protein MutS